MATEVDPIVGNWYRHLDKGQEFEVVNVDEGGGFVEVQHFDGNVESFDMEEWYDQNIEPTAAPENWSGPIDRFPEDDVDYTQTDMDREDWEQPLDETANKD